MVVLYRVVDTHDIIPRADTRGVVLFYVQLYGVQFACSVLVI